MKRVREKSTSPTSAVSADNWISTRSAVIAGVLAAPGRANVTLVRLACRSGQTLISGAEPIETSSPLHSLISLAMLSRTRRVDAAKGRATTAAATRPAAKASAHRPRLSKGAGILFRQLRPD